MPNRRSYSFDPAVTVDLRQPEPPPPSPPTSPSRTRPIATQIDGLAGLCMLVLLITGLGLPLPGGHLAVDAVLVITGYQLGLGVLRLAGRSSRWVARFWLSAIGPIVIPTVLAVALSTACWWWLDRLGPAEVRGAVSALAMVANVVPLVGDASSPATDHLWLVSLIVQFAIVCPLAMVVARRKGGRRTVTRLLIAIAAAALTTRLTLALQGVPASALPTLAIATRLDGLAIGLGLALAPRSLLGRVPSFAAAPAFTGLLAIFALAPDPRQWPVVTLAVLAPIVALATALILANRITGDDDDALARVLGNIGPRWLGERAITVYVWHQLFGMALTERAGQADLFGTEWPGASLFVTQLVFALAAGAATYRYLQVPLRTVAWRFLAGDRDRSAPTIDEDQRQHPGGRTLPLTA